MTEQIVQQSGALEWMQFVQHLLVALIAWVSIGVYGSFYVIKSLTFAPARRRTHQEINALSLADVDSNDPSLADQERDDLVRADMDQRRSPEPPRIALDVAFSGSPDAGWPELFEDIEVPHSPKELRLAALVICGIFGVIAVLVLVALGWVGRRHYRIRGFVIRWLLTGGPDWVW